MGVISMKALLEAGVHFGHQTRRWNPKMAKYIYTSRNGIHIIDLQKASDLIDVAYKAMFEIAQQGGRVLFVGTKKQSQEPVKEEAIRSGQFYVDQRWLGGTLTNFKTIKHSIKKLHDLYKMEADGTFKLLPKKEVIGLHKDMERLEKFLGGIKEMRGLPQALFIIDPRKERNAILEARKLGIPVFGIIDTNCDPDEVDYIIPANDDALRSVKLIVGKMADAVIEANGGSITGVSPVSLEDDEDDSANDEESEDDDQPKKAVVKPETKPAATPAPRPYVKPQTTSAPGQKPYVKPSTPYAKPSQPYAKPSTPYAKPAAPYVKPQTTQAAPVQKPLTTPVVAAPVATPVEVKIKVVAPVEAKVVAPVEAKVVAPVEAKKEVAAPVVVAPVATPVEVKIEVTAPVVKPAAVKKAVVAAVVDFESKTVAELKEIAKEKGLSNYSKLRKAELIEELLKN